MEKIILFAPLVGAIIAGFGWRIIGDKGAQLVTTALLFLSCVLSWIVFIGHDGTLQQIHILEWVQSGVLDSSWSIRMDRLTAIMLIVVTTVSALVHLYSIGYMAHDHNFAEGVSYRPRFFAYLSLFTFAMLMLVTADNLLQMFFGWEGVGLASYLLIGFYYRKPSANAAAMACGSGLIAHDRSAASDRLRPVEMHSCGTVSHSTNQAAPSRCWRWIPAL